MALSLLPVSAQVTVEVLLDQTQFLPGESLPVAVRIVNRSGQPLHLGATSDWLTFTVESVDGFNVVKRGDPPVQGEFDLGSSQMATKRVDLAPYFNLTRQGSYRVTATVNIRDWNVAVPSAPQPFDVIEGAELWSQAFGVPLPAGVTNALPEIRKYTLEEANYLRSQLRMYVIVTAGTDSRVVKVRPIGPMVSFSRPEAQLDRFSNLHVLYQSGARTFTYTVVSPDGNFVRQEKYDYLNARPRLQADDHGNVTVLGGVRRVMPEDVPLIVSPEETQTSRSQSPAPTKP